MANKKYKLTDGNMWATDGIHDFGQNKTQRTINSEVNAALGGKAPTNHASTATTYGKGTSSNYGHVKISDSLTDTTPAATGGVVPSMKAVSDLNGALNDKLDKSAYIADANTTGSGSNSPIFYQINSATTHTPYTEGVSVYSGGLIIEYRTSATQCVQFCIYSGLQRSFIRKQYQSTWTPWYAQKDTQTIQRGNGVANVTAGAVTQTNITFDYAFPAAPIVCVTISGVFDTASTLAAIGWAVPRTYVTTTGFRLDIGLPSGSTITQLGYQWIAVN